MAVTHVDFLMIGGGLASVTAAETLRNEGAQGSIAILCREHLLPYHRPSLSKRFLRGLMSEQKLLIHPESFYRDRSIDVVRQAEVTSVHPSRQRVHTAGAGIFHYGKLLIATGGLPNRLDIQNSDLAGAHYLHTVDDASAIRADLERGVRHAVIMGGSFLGLEVASTLCELGVAVTVIERAPTILPLLHAPLLSDYFRQRCEVHGVRVITGTGVAALYGASRVEAVETLAGERIPCDLMLAAVGTSPCVSFLRQSGLALDNGILVDAFLQASRPHVFAAGDVTNFIDTVFARRRRIEHWDNAVKQGALAARNMLGQRRRYDDVSMYYCDIFDTSFSFSGCADDVDEIIPRGSLEDKSFSLFYLKDNVPRALFSIGRGAEETYAAEALIRYRVNLHASMAQLADERASLSSLPSQTVLILQGGGCLGAFECGASRALEEAGASPDVVAAVSIGAFNGAIIASHPGHAAQALASFWKELSICPLAMPGDAMQRIVAAWQVCALGVPNFFRPRWMLPYTDMWMLPWLWTSLYDASPIRQLITRYVDFANLKSSPVRLLISAVNVATSELEVFDSYVDELSPAHLLASGSLPPGLPWTMIGDKPYWDGGIVSNSPIDLMLERCGPVGKRVFVIDLFSGQKRLPANLAEVVLRRDEIVYADRMQNDARFVEHAGEFRELVREILHLVEPDAIRSIEQRPRYIRLMGNRAGLTVTRIVRNSDPAMPHMSDYDFSAATIARLQVQGYEAAKQALQERGKDGA